MLSDVDTLSWVVLGRASASSGGESILMQQAALALLGGLGKGGSGGSSRRTAPQRVDARVGGAQEQRLRELLEAWPHAAASTVRAVPRALPHLGPGGPLCGTVAAPPGCFACNCWTCF